MTINLPPVLVIHQKKHFHRYERLCEQFAQHGFFNVTFIEAIDGTTLNPEPPWNDVHPWKNWSDPYASRAMTLGEVGCTLSHVKAWEHIISTDMPALIIEDDAKIIDKLVDVIPKVLHDLDHVDFDLCYFSHRNRPPPKPLLGRHIHAVDYHPMWTLAYILMPEGAKSLLETPWKTHLIPADEMLPAAFGLNRNPQINKIYQTSDIPVISTNQNFFQPAESSELSETEKSPPIIDKTELKAFTVATEDNYELQRLLKSGARYGMNIEPLGLGTEWKGGDVEQGHGGGQKINLLREALKKLPEDTPVLFMDGYDTIVTGHVNDIMETWKKFDQVPVFASEVTCWPDKSLANDFPPSKTHYRFLNSGAFIGRAVDLLHMIQEPIADDADDQLYYTMKFGEGWHGIELDTKCEIFQCLNGSLNDIQIDRGRGIPYNKHTKTHPKIIHANGPTKLWLEEEGAAIGGRMRHYYGEMN